MQTFIATHGRSGYVYIRCGSEQLLNAVKSCYKRRRRIRDILEGNKYNPTNFVNFGGCWGELCAPKHLKFTTLNHMLSQETIYTHLQEKEYNSIIDLMHKHRGSLKDDPSNEHAIKIFLQEYFSALRSHPLSEDARHHLWKLFIIHTHKFYELPSEFAIQLIGICWDGDVNETWYKAALPYPNDPICARIIREHEGYFQKKSAKAEMTVDPILKNLTQAEGGWFEIDAHFGPFQPYLKMYVRGDEHVVALSELLSTLPSVRTANVTNKRNGKRDLTIYHRRPYKLEETHEQVELAANAYFSGGPFDPIFKEETISAISDKAYYEILDYLIRAGLSLEKSKDVKQFGEETIRGYLVSFLNAISTKHFVSGETFNKDGKSDILVQNEFKVNLLVAECKLWKGPDYLSNAINQLFDRYVTWRDEKAAILIFNTSAVGFTNIVYKALDTLKAHPYFYLYKGPRSDTSFSFILHNPTDPAKLVQLELVLFNFV